MTKQVTPDRDESTARAWDLSSGSVTAFRSSWVQRPESKRYHFTRGKPRNQIQFAFQNHWRVFSQVMGDLRAGRAIEVGSGRGSMGAFFAAAGFETHLLDTSHSVLKIAQQNFDGDALEQVAVCGDTLSLPYSSDTFDVLVSIGLLEHFEDIRAPMLEQLRVLKPGGVFLGYVVPERPISVQTLAIPVNLTLKAAHTLYQLARRDHQPVSVPKSDLYRNTYTADAYLEVFKAAGVHDMGSFGMFPVPLVSHSYQFPFSLMAPPLERGLVGLWRLLLALRPGPRDPWTCPERWGLAFLVWARK